MAGYSLAIELLHNNFFVLPEKSFFLVLLVLITNMFKKLIKRVNILLLEIETFPG